MTYRLILCLFLSSSITIQSAIAAVVPSIHDKAKDLYREGLAFKKSGNLERALECFVGAIARNNNLAGAYLEAARIHAQLENYRESIYYYQADLKIDSLQATAWYELGMICFNTQDFTTALIAFEKAGSLGIGTDATFHFNMGVTCLQLKQTARGIKLLQAALTLNPADTQIMNNLAHAYFKQGNYPAAIEQWNRVVQLQPQNAFALFMLGKSYIELGEREKGTALCDSAVSI
jgi:tetratricopeptide (TPR) repeat protein